MIQVETVAVKELERIVREAALQLWPQSRVGVFGSQSCAMALPGSDVDITILDVSGPPKKGAAGFTLKQRKAVVQVLSKQNLLSYAHIGWKTTCSVVDHAVTDFICAGVTQAVESAHKAQGGLWKGTGDGSGIFVPYIVCCFQMISFVSEWGSYLIVVYDGMIKSLVA